MQVALYARVSTSRQAENDLSIPDQLRQMRQWAERQGHVVVREYIEPGNTATDDKRPVFQDVMLDAERKPAMFQLIVVHSFSRFFRDMIEAALYEKKLRKSGVKLESITQYTNDDPAGEMQRRIIMMFDEYQSKENAKHTLRGMQENARQGYFNGSKAPYGYKTIDAGQTGMRGRQKKKLAIEPAEAEVVHEIFELYVNGKDDAPRIGMKEIANTLNRRNVFMRGKPWRVQKVQNILSCLTYVGWHVFNRTDSKTMKRKNESEWIKIPVPAIIDQNLFDKTTKVRGISTPFKTAPRRAASPNLLTGLLKCGCGATMVLMTAKNARYRYYKCSSRISKGNTVCKSGNFPMEKLDGMVLDAFRQKVYTPEHIHEIIDIYRKHTNKHGGEDKQRTKKLETELKEIEQAEDKLYQAVEMGVMELSDRLKERVQKHKTRRDMIASQLAALQRKNQTPLQILTPQKIKAATLVINKRFSHSTPFSRAYLKATLSEISIHGDFLKLKGENKSMASLIATNGSIDPNGLVHGFVPHGTPFLLFIHCIKKLTGNFISEARSRNAHAKDRMPTRHYY